jgi:enoyl-CoA hydratase/carnithine racemase
MAAPTPPDFKTISVTFDGAVGRLTLDQPERRNPIGSRALVELAEAATWFDEVGALIVVITGAGPAFSAGFDLKEMRGGADEGLDPRESPARGAAMAEAISQMKALTIAAVNGPCVGGGFVLALCCDMRIATEDAWFSLPEAELGIPLAWSGVPRLVRELGAPRATELILTCRRVSAGEAQEWGLLNRVVDRDSLENVIEGLSVLLLARRPDVIKTTKRQVADAADVIVPTTGDWAGTEQLEAALRTLAGGG